MHQNEVGVRHGKAAIRPRSSKELRLLNYPQRKAKGSVSQFPKPHGCFPPALAPFPLAPSVPPAQGGGCLASEAPEINHR